MSLGVVLGNRFYFYVVDFVCVGLVDRFQAVD